LWFFCVLCLVLIPFFIVLQLNDPIRPEGFWTLVAVTSGGAVVLGVFAVRQTTKYRRLANSTERRSP
jgi:hypothetical protein